MGTLVCVLLAALGGSFLWLWAAADVSTVGSNSFRDELAIPPLAEPAEVKADGTKVFDLWMQAGETEFRAGLKTPTWGFNGSHLGPTLRAARGDKVEIRVHNRLDEPSTVHWHGMHVPARMDGGPHQTVRPGRTWTPRWEIDQPAATLWYPVTFFVAPQWGAWPPGPVWLCAPCRTDDNAVALVVVPPVVQGHGDRWTSVAGGFARGFAGVAGDAGTDLARAVTGSTAGQQTATDLRESEASVSLAS